MQGLNIVRIVLIAAPISFLFVSNIYFYSCLEEFRNALEKASKTSLNQQEVLSLIDDALTARDRQRARELLTQLQSQYQLAALNTPENRLTYGDPKAPILLQEFGDIECPYCRKMHAQIKQLVDQSQGIIKWEFKHFPLGIHSPSAAIESQAVECIKEAYDNRTAWIAIDRFMEETAGNGKGVGDIPEFVRSFGLNGSLIGNCLASNSHRERVDQDYSDGQSKKIAVTPSIVIQDHRTGGNYLLNGYHTLEQLQQSLQKILAQ